MITVKTVLLIELTVVLVGESAEVDSVQLEYFLLHRNKLFNKQYTISEMDSVQNWHAGTYQYELVYDILGIPRKYPGISQLK